MRNLAAAVRGALQTTRVVPEYLRLAGGLDQMTPHYERAPGTIRFGQNFEADINGGYRRIAGYERYDGRPSPSDALYAILTATITGSPSVGATLVGASSGATGVIIALPGGSFVLTKVTGTFTNGENLQVSAVTIATASGSQTVGSASTPLLHATYLNLAADEYRDDIGVPTGSGAILGGFYLNGVNYCFRNNAGATAAVLWKSSSSGWTSVSLGRQVSFTSGGTTEIVEGNTITGAISAATAVVSRVVVTSGTWGAGTAAGKLILSSQTGTFQAENLDVGASLNLATIAGNSTAITLSPSGRYECVKENFGGAANATRVYGCDGVNKGFEFDGTVYVPIDTGMTTDTPDHVIAHKKHLFFSFDGSVQHSGIGTPYIWTVVTGATEIGMGDTVTGFASQPGSSSGAALAIFTRNRLSILYGSSSSDWNLVPYRDELGAYAHTIQDVGFTMFLDDRGVTDIQTSQAYGNFSHGTRTNAIKTLMNEYRTVAVASCISRDRSQYRLFFTNNHALYVTVVGTKVVGIMDVLYTDTPRCTWTSEDSSGNELMFMGSDDGYVYQLDKGTSFDGEAIEYYAELAYNFSRSPRVEKEYQDCTIEVSGSAYATFTFGYSLGYGSTDIAQPNTQTVTTNFAETRWDAFTWDAFIWDGVTLQPSVVPMDGTAENVSIAIRGSSDMYQPFTLTSMLIHYAPLGRMRP